MPLITRQLSNAGAPLYSPTGTLLTGVSISFTLVDETGGVTDAFDVITSERVIDKVSTVTDSNGIFSINLWPNDRGDKVTKYVCSIARKDILDFASQVPSGDGTLSWYNFKHNGAILSPTEIAALDVHIGDALLHLSSAQNTLLDGIAPTVTSAEINMLDGVTSPIQTQFNNLPLSNVYSVDGLTGVVDLSNSSRAPKVSPSFTGNIRSVLLGSENIEIDGTTDPRIMTRGVVRVNHKAGMNSTRALTLAIDANGHGDTNASVVEYLATNLTPSDETHVHQVNVDTDNSTGGSISAIATAKTGNGLSTVHGMHSLLGVSPILQTSGTLASATSALIYNSGVYTDVTSQLSNNVTNVPLFVANLDYLYIGNSTKFTSIDVALTGFASGLGISPTFEYSDGVNSWKAASPSDGTNGFRQNGVIYMSGSPLDWVTRTVDGVGGMFWIRIRRTNSAVITSPIESRVQVDSSTFYRWDAEGKLDISRISIRNLPTYSTVSNAIGGGLVAGDVFRDTNGALFVV